MVALTSSQTVLDAIRMPYITAEEAYALMRTELERFLALVETLDPDDWGKPTACTAWNVRDMLAHQAGGYASGTSYKEMFRQYSARRKPGQLPEDATNALQLSERAGKSPTELIAELRRVGPVAIQKWAYQFRFAKLLVVPHPIAGSLSIRHLMWVIHSRDTWMHRLDICRATGRNFAQTAEHDRRIVELIVKDTELNLVWKKYSGPALLLELSGLAGGAWKLGRGEPAATIHMDALDFCIFASGRFNYEEARRKMTISDGAAAAETALKKILVLF